MSSSQSMGMDNDGTSKLKPPPLLPSKTSYVSTSLYIGIILALGCLVVVYARNLFVFLESANELGPLGSVIFILSYIPTALPFSVISYYIPLTLSSGFMYGYLVGMLTATLGSVSSACLGFLIARKFCRAWIEEKIHTSTKLTAIMTSLESHSFKITLIMRFLPIPFGLQNGLCAMTPITLHSFAVASFIGLAPENTLLVYLGRNFRSFSEISHGNFNTITLYDKILLSVAVAVGILMFVMARRLMKTTAYQHPPQRGDEDGLPLEEHSDTIPVPELTSVVTDFGDPDDLPQQASIYSSVVSFKNSGSIRLDPRSLVEVSASAKSR